MTDDVRKCRTCRYRRYLESRQGYACLCRKGRRFMRPVRETGRCADWKGKDLFSDRPDSAWHGGTNQ